VNEPSTQYAITREGVCVAYKTLGDGPHSMIFSPGWVTNLEVLWEWPACVRFFERLARRCRLVVYDKQGTGLSDPEEQAEVEHTATLLPLARVVELPPDHWSPYVADPEPLVGAIEGFLDGVEEAEGSLDRALATVLFTDIVDSTAREAELGDRAWRIIVERHHRAVRAMLARYRGTEVDTAGDGFFATFDGPARAVRCAQACLEAVRSLGIEIRAGVHTGEVEMIDGKAGGIAVNIGARVGAKALPSQVLVSQTVKDLVAGSGLSFEAAGEHELKGIPEPWRLYRVVT
jgi:class 3 adenylate cyclase